MKALLIRHATSTHQDPDAPLAEEGYVQAQALVAVLTNLRAGPLYASPYRRAQETIAPYAETSDQSVAILDGLRERTLSPVKLPDWQDHIQQSYIDPDYAPDGGESHNDLRFRASEALENMQALGGHLPAFVTHGGLTSALFSGIDPDFGFADWKALRNPDLFEVEIDAGQVLAFERLEMEISS